MRNFELTRKKEAKVTISIRISVEILNILEQLSQNTKLSRNEIINQCIEFALKKYETEKQQEL